MLVIDENNNINVGVVLNNTLYVYKLIFNKTYTNI